MIELIRRELMTIRFGGDRQSQNAHVYLLGFLHCAFYYGGMITPERYDLIMAMAENAAEHRNNVNVRITA